MPIAQPWKIGVITGGAMLLIGVAFSIGFRVGHINGGQDMLGAQTDLQLQKFKAMKTLLDTKQFDYLDKYLLVNINNFTHK